ncbi:hypothetical protein [Vibrio phage phiKT1028]|nr:hypothetical protein [Vibrio phage phiKT1028]
MSTNKRAYIDHYRLLLGMEAKLKPVDLDRGERLAKEMEITDKEATALFTVLYFHIRSHVRISHEKAVIVAYTTSEGVRLLGTGISRDNVVLEIIAIPSKFVQDEDLVVNLADLALGYFETLIEVATYALKQGATA